jgi:hypothetical protein
MNLKATREVNVRELARILHEMPMTQMVGKFEFNQQREGEIYFQHKQDRTPVVWPTFEHGYPFIADTKVLMPTHSHCKRIPTANAFPHTDANAFRNAGGSNCARRWYEPPLGFGGVQRCCMYSQSRPHTCL